MMKMPGMFSCREVHEIVSTGAFEDLGLFARMRFRLHLLMCHHCARYSRQIVSLGQASRRLLGMPTDPERCRKLESAVMEHFEARRPDPPSGDRG
jgi:hypothetical protein